MTSKLQASSVSAFDVGLYIYLLLELDRILYEDFISDNIDYLTNEWAEYWDFQLPEYHPSNFIFAVLDNIDNVS